MAGGREHGGAGTGPGAAPHGGGGRVLIETVVPREARGGRPADDAVILAWEARRRGRQRLISEGGRELHVALPTGTHLRPGDGLLAPDGALVEVRAADEALLVVRAGGLALARAAYHLGNLHRPAAIGPDAVATPWDRVLAERLAALGLAIARETGPFEPEGSAWQAGHAHDRGVTDAHRHAEGDARDHAHGEEGDETHAHEHAHGGHEDEHSGRKPRSGARPGGGDRHG